MIRDVVTPREPAGWQCHGSTMVVLADGGLLVAWFAGSHEGADDCAIWIVRGRAGNWAEPKRLTRDRDAFWNPVLAHSPSGSLTLFFKRGRPISKWTTWVTSSEDGLVWAPARELVPGDVGGRGPAKNPPLVLPSGAWLAGGSTESGGSGGATTHWACFGDLSSDDGRTWQRSADLEVDRTRMSGAGLIQPTAWWWEDHVTFLMRSTSGLAWRAQSSDEGRTWSVAQPTSLPNNNSGLCATRLADGRIVCAANTSDVPWGPRNELELWVSRDDGHSWRRSLNLDRLPAPESDLVPADAGVKTDGKGELSYPTVVAEGSRVLISYTRRRREIVVAAVETTDLD